MTARLGERLALPAAWAAVVVLFGALEPDRFLTASNFEAIFASQAVLAVLGLALIVPLTAGDYDLSVASVLSLSAMMVAVLNVDHGWPVGWAVAAALAAGLAVGAVNGAIVVLLRLDSFVITLGTGTVVAGIVLWISDSRTIGGVSDRLVEAVAVRELLGVPLGFWYGVLLAAAVWYLFEYTPAGRRMLFVGRGRRVARMSGVRVGRVRVGALIASGGLAAVAGVLSVGEQGGADPSSGASLLLPAFAAAFLGATSIVPGRFNPWGTLIAAYFLATGVTGLQILGAESFVQQLFYGGALIVAVAVTRLARTRTAVDDPDSA
ncbi:MAG TPA: ABC transporter permease [Miltoncostaeaceae bacterium]|nr:ABC transporter permease [Miltoncostaeaceae bacterium]